MIKQIRFCKISLVAFIIIFNNILLSQSQPNSLYFEALGNGGLYSVNYDRLFSENLGFRIGFSYLSELDFIFTSVQDFLVIPVTVNYFVGTGNSKLELGAGIAYLSVSGGKIFGLKSSTGTSTAVCTGTIGYRYQQSEGGFLFRIGLTPFFGSGEVSLSGGVSLGLSF